MLLPRLPRGCTASPMEAGSSPGQLGSLSKGLRHSREQHMVLPPGALLFAGEQEGAQGTAAASRRAPGGQPDPLTYPELLGSSASVPWLSGQAPSPWWTFPEAAFNRSICRVYPAMLQQLPAALAGSAAIGGGCPKPRSHLAKGVRELRTPSRINCPDTTIAPLHVPASSQGPTSPQAPGAAACQR